MNNECDSSCRIKRPIKEANSDRDRDLLGSAIELLPAFFPIDILPRRCICTTRVESRDSQMESTKTIAFPIQSVDPTSLFPY